jgi:hypothetical protein
MSKLAFLVPFKGMGQSSKRFIFASFSTFLKNEARQRFSNASSSSRSFNKNTPGYSVMPKPIAPVHNPNG